jgi:hypothetical protein
MPNAACRITSSEEQGCENMLDGQNCHWSESIYRYEWRNDRLLRGRENPDARLKKRKCD